MLMTKDQIRDELNYIVKKICKNGKFSEAYTKLYKAYNLYGSHKVNLIKDNNSIMEEIYRANRMEELYYVALKVFKNELNMPLELEIKIKEIKERNYSALFGEQKSYEDYLKPVSIDDIKKIFNT